MASQSGHNTELSSFSNLAEQILSEYLLMPSEIMEKIMDTVSSNSCAQRNELSTPFSVLFKVLSRIALIKILTKKETPKKIASDLYKLAQNYEIDDDYLDQKLSVLEDYFSLAEQDIQYSLEHAEKEIVDFLRAYSDGTNINI